MFKRKAMPVCVEPQQRVRLFVQTDVLRIITAGRALERGRKGQIVRSVNLRTGREVSGIVTGKGSIHVEM
jgi:flagella basal body P-ring formation protein FlgA